MSTRWTPAASAASTCSAERKPPPTWSRVPRLRAASRVEHGGVLGAALAVARGVEIDHVQPAGARQRRSGRPASSGVSSKPVDAPEVALQQPHDAPAGEIDGGDDLHCHVTMLTCRS